MQDGGEQHAHRLAKINAVSLGDISQDPGGGPHITGDDSDAWTGEQRAGVGEDQTVVVHVDSPRGRVGLLGDLMDGGLGGQPTKPAGLPAPAASAARSSARSLVTTA